MDTALVTPEEWAAFELKAAGWKPVYNPPQIGSSCSARLARCVINSSCLCVGPCCRAAFDLPCCCPTDSFRLTKPEAAFGRMLERASTKRRTAYDGVWWMEDNVAGEGLLTLQDAEWFSDSLFFKTAGYNWTVDSCSTGVALVRRLAHPLVGLRDRREAHVRGVAVGALDHDCRLRRPDKGSQLDLRGRRGRRRGRCTAAGRRCVERDLPRYGDMAERGERGERATPPPPARRGRRRAAHPDVREAQGRGLQPVHLRLLAHRRLELHPRRAGEPVRTRAAPARAHGSL
ncbi:hypothetical protein EMIHUDRAFT_420202, partial [Emiliania huxleyi CCMP1516]|uniref:SMB domain-containing protein n=2 Tax=Emiliania huxleyi TaxID=2903 RepID=A0A0D3L0F6_EMIH1